MRISSWCVLVLSSAAFAQNRAIQDCQENVADALGIANGNVSAQFGGNGDNGNPVVEWEANLGGRRIRGFCETKEKIGNSKCAAQKFTFPPKYPTYYDCEKRKNRN